jgi:hypothetical protein
MSLSKKAVLFNVTFSLPSGTKVDKKESSKVATNHLVPGGRRSAGSYQKIIIDPSLFKEVKKLKRNVEGYFNVISIAYAHDKMPVIVPNGKILEATAFVREHKRLFDNEISAIKSAYDAKKEEAKTRLMTLYNEDDYLDHDDFIARFSFDYWMRPIPELDSMDLRWTVSREEERLMKESMQKEMEENLGDSMGQALRMMSDHIKHMKDVVSKDSPRIHDSMIEKIHEIAESMPGIVGLSHDPNSKMSQTIQDICLDLRQIQADDLRGSGLWEADNRDVVADQSTEMINKLENLYHGCEAQD